MAEPSPLEAAAYILVGGCIGLVLARTGIPREPLGLPVNVWLGAAMFLLVLLFLSDLV